MSQPRTFVTQMPDVSMWQEAFEKVAARFDQMAQTFQAFTWEPVPLPVPEAWEAYALRILGRPRPPVGTRAHTTAAHDTADDIVRYLTQVARIREESTP